MAVHPPEHEAKELRPGESLPDGFLSGRGALAGPELDAAARHQVEGGDACAASCVSIFS
jgi:hypothetical protein